MSRFSSEIPGIRSEVLMAVFSLVPSARVAMPGICGFLKIHREREIPMRIVNPRKETGREVGLSVARVAPCLPQKIIV